MTQELIETAIGGLKAGDIIALEEGKGRVTKIEARSHMPSIFQDCWGRDGMSVHWVNIDGPHEGKKGAERAHRETTVNKVVA